MSVERNHNFADHLAYPLSRAFVAGQPVPPAELFSVMFSKDGAGATIDMVTTAATSYQVIVPANKVYVVNGLEAHLVDASIDPDKFGGIAALSNGCLVRVLDTDGTTVLTTISATPIKTNADFLHLGYGVLTESLATVNDLVSIVIDFTLAYGYPMYLTAGQAVEIKVQDNLTGLVSFEASLHGRVLDNT